MHGDKRKAILKSALELINEQGFHGTSMSHLAKHANVAAGTIYHYFESKEMMICAVHTDIVDRLLERLQGANDLELAYKERAKKVWMAFYNFHVENPAILRFYEQFVNSPYYFQNTHRMRISEFFIQIIEDGIAQGIIVKQNPEILSTLFIGSMISSLKMTCYKEMNLSQQDLDAIMEIQWRGMST